MKLIWFQHALIFTSLSLCILLGVWLVFSSFLKRADSRGSETFHANEFSLSNWRFFHFHSITSIQDQLRRANEWTSGILCRFKVWAVEEKKSLVCAMSFVSKFCHHMGWGSWCSFSLSRGFLVEQGKGCGFPDFGVVVLDTPPNDVKYYEPLSRHKLCTMWLIPRRS